MPQAHRRICVCIALAVMVSACQFVESSESGLGLPASATAVPEITATVSRQVGPTPTAAHEPPPTRAVTPDTLTSLRDNPMPPADPEALVRSMASSDVGNAVSPTSAPAEVGDRRAFWLADVDLVSYRSISATLRVQLDHVQMWVQDDVAFDQDALERSARVFCETIYPVVREAFGHEWVPGIDGEPRLLVLNGQFSGAMGYFGSANELSRQANPYSNLAEMFVMNLGVLQPGTPQYESTLAHEFQHMIHWHQDRNESSWLNEGASQLAEVLAGYEPPYVHIASFAGQPDTQLTTWSDGPDVSAHYGASYLFISYLHDRLGQDLIRQLVAEPQDGMAGIDAVLTRMSGPTTDELVADWLVANLGVAEDDPRYRHSAKVGLQPVTWADIPQQVSEVVHPYAADYYALPLGTEMTLFFEGVPTAKVVDNQPAGGSYQWWSNRGDSSHSRLMREIDLSQVLSATLTYDVWYDIEPGWDYGHIRVSMDGGKTWDLLRAPQMTDYNPAGNALGWGYTGASGVSPEAYGMEPVWIREEVDLADYVGEVIQLSLDYITDDAVTYRGLCVDNVAIDAIGWHDDAEASDPGWVSYGFVRHDNTLPQRYLVRVVEARQGDVEVQDLAVDGHGSATWQLSTPSEADSVVLIVASMTQGTVLPASYSLVAEELSKP